jgi:parvulin-like peptidyl-prolyl isomerase
VKKTLTAILVFAVAVVAIAQNQPAPANDPIVIAAGSLTIRQSEFENAVKTLPQEYQQYATGPGKKQFAEDYLRMKMLAAEGTKNGLDKDPEVVRQMNLMRENLIANAQIKRIENEIKISDADLQKAYEANKNQYEQVKARHILVAFKGSAAAQPGKPELTEEQAKAKAEDIRKQLVAGASFEELAKKESDDTGSGARGGDLGSFGRGMMVEEFEKAAFETKPGEIAPVTRTQFGYHIIKVDEHNTTSFAEVKEQLERAERQKKMQEALDAMKTNAKATFNEAYFAPPAPPVQPAAQPATTPAPAPAPKP